VLAAASGQIALSGGGTVGRVYELAAARRLDWSGVHVWFGDDRAVPPGDERSNYRLVRTKLIDPLSRLPEVHRIPGELGAEAAAARYDEELVGVTLDLALNGIGPDGHTASLFPGAPGLDERERRAVAAEAGLEPFVERVTMTPPMFAGAALLVYLVTGAEKADAVRRAFADPPSPTTPASLIRGRETVAILDAAAASGL
jgi:6-phosphogluconolactonase